ncbi:MAG: hypothetical protein ACRER5_03830, partial [Pseudomonas sp.]
MVASRNKPEAGGGSTSAMGSTGVKARLAQVHQAAKTTVVSKAVLKRVPIGNIAALLVATTLIGQALGFLRTKLINANFSVPGPPGPNDAGVYFAAFNIPDLFFYVIAAGALGVTLMPYLSDRLHKNDRQGMWELSNSVLNLLGVLTLVVGLI